jgi:hypothetical protein
MREAESEHAAGAKHPESLPHSGIEMGPVHERHERDHGVEAPVLEDG